MPGTWTLFETFKNTTTSTTPASLLYPLSLLPFFILSYYPLYTLIVGTYLNKSMWITSDYVIHPRRSQNLDDKTFWGNSKLSREKHHRLREE
jgi:hypothetical protein